MRSHPYLLASLLLLSIVTAHTLYTRQRLGNLVLKAAAQEKALPREVLWIWERPEDVHGIDPRTTGLAVLRATLHLGSSVAVTVRHQPLLEPEGVVRLAVVRLESSEEFATHTNDAALLESAVARLDSISREPGTAAIQIDFDAKRSERAFYRRLLIALRQRLPAALPLEMTALVSWCSTDDWISDLPVNAATPMFFRMEPDRRRLSLEGVDRYRVREPLCLSSVGVSTTEPWPRNTTGKRVYVFADRGWARDMAMLQAPQAAKTMIRREQP